MTLATGSFADGVCVALAFVHPQQILSKCFHLPHADTEKSGSQRHTLNPLKRMGGIFWKMFRLFTKATRINLNHNKDLISKKLREIEKI